MKRAMAGLVCGGLSLLLACGGGGGGGGGGSPGSSSTSSSSLTITTDSILPGTLHGAQYSATLSASGASGSVLWSIAAASPTALFPTGVTISAQTGVVSGTANWYGTAVFIATAADSGGHSTTKPFYITAGFPLAAGAAPNAGLGQFQAVGGISIQTTGGVAPLSYRVTSGVLPPGVVFNSSGQLGGTALNTGSFPVTVQVQDSFTPPETVSISFVLTVVPPPLSLALSLPSRLYLNRSFSGRVIATGGVPPYSFSMVSGTVPPGLSAVDPSSGQISGTPTSVGQYYFTIQVKDSASSTSTNYYAIGVAAPLGRNDSPATATPVGNGSFQASISPYQDPPNGVPYAADHDYYKVVAQGGQTVHLETYAKRANANNPLDTVLEVLDANNNRLTTCRPSNTTGAFTQPCINDDIVPATNQDSALDVQVPGPNTASTAIYVNVFDWRGDARPDMSYSLQVSGALTPFQLGTTVNTVWYDVGQTGKTITFTALGGGVPYTWTVASGSLPPGITLSSGGVFSGTPTSAGTYPTTIQVADMLSHVLQQPVTFNVGAPLSNTTAATLPDAIAGTSYSYQFTSSGGSAPLNWYADWGNTSSDGLYLAPQGTLSGIPDSAGTLSFRVVLSDQAQQSVAANYVLNVHPGSSLKVLLSFNGTSVNGFVGSTFYASVLAHYGTPPYTYSLNPATLPPGVTFNSATGIFGGTPTAKGTYTVTVSAVDSGNPQLSGSGQITITIN